MEEWVGGTWECEYGLQENREVKGDPHYGCGQGAKGAAI